MICSHLRHRMSNAVASQPLRGHFTLPDLGSLLSDEGQRSKSFVAEGHVVDCDVVGSEKRVIASQHLPLHHVVISNFEVDDAGVPFTLREQSVFRQIVHNGNVEFCPDIAVLIEPISSEALSWFLPGDQLIAINDVDVKSKDEAWRRVFECKLEMLKLSVRPLAEFTELSARHNRYHCDKDPCKDNPQQHNMRVSISQWF